MTSLTAECATFVDITHSSPGAVGVAEAVGHVDFFVNGLRFVQPGCLSVLCSHLRAWQYWIETAWPGREDNYKAFGCRSADNIAADTCTTGPIRFGFPVPDTARGSHYVKANEQSLFGPVAKPGFKPVCASA